MAGIWRNNPETREGKYLVTRRDGTVPEWPSFVLGARDPAAPSALRAYAFEAQRRGYDTAFVKDVVDLAADFEAYRRLYGDGDPDAPPHRTDDPATVAKMRPGKGA